MSYRTSEAKDAETWRLVRNAFLAANEASVGTVLGALALTDLDPKQPATTNFGHQVREIMCFRLAAKAAESIRGLDPVKSERIKLAVKMLREVFADSTVHIPMVTTPVDPNAN